MPIKNDLVLDYIESLPEGEKVSVRELAAKCEGPAAAWAPVADELWACSHSCESCQGCRQEA